jgi:hypothetical protein
MHHTNEAFSRYFKYPDASLRKIYNDAGSAPSSDAEMKIHEK